MTFGASATIGDVLTGQALMRGLAALEFPLTVALEEAMDRCPNSKTVAVGEQLMYDVDEEWYGKERRQEVDDGPTVDVLVNPDLESYDEDGKPLFYFI